MNAGFLPFRTNKVRRSGPCFVARFLASFLSDRAKTGRNPPTQISTEPQFLNLLPCHQAGARARQEDLSSRAPYATVDLIEWQQVGRCQLVALLVQKQCTYLL